MPSSNFFDASAPPGIAALAKRVGKSWGVVSAALDALGGKPGQVKHTWRFSKASGWYLTYDRGNKRLFYLFPKEGDLLLKLVFNEAGAIAIRGADLPKAVKDKLAKAKTYSEGTVLEFTAREFTSELLAELLQTKIASMR